VILDGKQPSKVPNRGCVLSVLLSIKDWVNEYVHKKVRYASLKLMPRFENPSLGRNSGTDANTEDLNANAEGLNANVEDT